MYLGNTLSRAYLEHPVPLSHPQSEFCHAAMEVLHLTEHFPISYKPLRSKYFQGDHYGSLKYVPPEAQPYVCEVPR